MCYEIIKSFNNNVLLCIDDIKKEEVMLIGTGIGFKRRSGETFTEVERIEKRFVLSDKENHSGYKEMYLSLNEQYIGIATEAVSEIAMSLGSEIPPKKMISVVDHIVFALQRHFEGIDLHSPFTNEVRYLYPKEWAIAENVVGFINRSLNIKLPMDEIAFIAIHVVSIIHENLPTENKRAVEMVADCIHFVQQQSYFELRPNSLAYARLVTHLRFVIERSSKGEQLKNPMKDQIREKLPEAYSVGLLMSRMLANRHNVQLVDDEIAFVALHLSRIVKQ